MRALLGSQTPAFEWVPSYVDSSGPEAVDFAKEYGLIAMPWQERVLLGGLGETGERTSAGKPVWSANEVCVICGRQNGKGFIIEARELAGVFVFGEELILHSAHQQRTSNDAFERMTEIVETHPDLDSQLAAKYRSKGEEGFTFHIKGLGHKSRKRTCRIRYMARTGGAGRGFTKANCVILDEAMILDSGPVAALIPTMATQEAWQVWYFASQGDIRLPTSSTLLAEVRSRGFRKADRIAFYEWAAHLRHDERCPRDDAGRPTDALDVRADESTWGKANPSMGRLISTQFLSDMIIGGMMPKWDADREFLGVGEYPAADGWSLVPSTTWESLYDANSRRGRRFCVGISVAPDQSTSAVAIASVRPDGMWHWELLRVDAGTAWVARYVKALMLKRPALVVIDMRSPIVGDIIDVVGPRRIKHPSTVEYPSWCAKMLQVIVETYSARHIGQTPLTDALRFLEKKVYPSGGFVWQKHETRGDITPFDALTLASGGIMSKNRRRMSMATTATPEVSGGQLPGRETRIRGAEPAQGVSVLVQKDEQEQGRPYRERWPDQGGSEAYGAQGRAHAQEPAPLTRGSRSMRELIDAAMARRGR